jgi:hypothetical protein
MKKKNTRKMNLSKETLTTLEANNLTGAAAQIGCQESHIVCSIRHTCVSCRPTEATICA